LDLGWDTRVVLLLAGLMFLWALLLGVVKYRQMAGAADGLAHPYTDTAHRAALLYSFALVLVATFVELSEWSEVVDMLAAGAMAFYFFAAVGSYMVHGLRRDTDNQMRDPARATTVFMHSLIAAEIGGWLALLAGFAAAQIL
jgi:hypothetical protein